MAQWLAYLLHNPATPGSIPSAPKTFPEKNIVYVTNANQLSCLEQSGQWLENIDQTQTGTG